mgnify:CR=1 FL=1
MGLVTIKKSHVGSELMVLKSRLESEGIRCYLRNEYTTRKYIMSGGFDILRSRM